ncbi:hypothetical protein GV829_12600 [Sphingomonas lacunae]|uniref:Uncharacterized protein n=1 Tax=Sphingomonas lacunae TaxID=2698828 RepID=A0A6M4AVM2_9SPHN|nr:hypothetical protein [Sphingomonas lacunae]QJQ33173.1 hypothetical protein GV829_12600 [Sphingomonas lacunae]
MPQKPKWTAATRAAFIARLAECGEVRAALATVGLSPNSAYRLRATDPDFARAWDAALLHSRQTIVAELTSRALHGWQEEVWFRGELVGTRTRHDSRLLLALIARLDAAAGKADEERVRRAAPHFGDVLAALRHDVPLDPWFAASLAEKQEQAIDKACRRQRFWHFAALMDDEMIADVMGPDPRCADEEEEWPEKDQDEEEEEDDQEREALPTSAVGHPAFSCAADAPGSSKVPPCSKPAGAQPLTSIAEGLGAEADLSPPRGCHPVSTMASEAQGKPPSVLALPADVTPPPTPPQPEPMPGPLNAIEREAVEGDMAVLCLARIGSMDSLTPYPLPP